MIFAALPTDFPALTAALQAVGETSASAPPDLEDMGKRLRALFALATEARYRGLPVSALRKLPYAYWLPPDLPLKDLHAPLVERYWSDEILGARIADDRKAKRWLTPLFHVYCTAFSSSDPHFAVYSASLRQALERAAGSFAEELRELQRRHDFFQPWSAPLQIAGALVTDHRRLDETLLSLRLWPGFLDTALGHAAFRSALGLGPEKFREWPIVARILDWVRQLGVRIVNSEHRVKFANALLEPWAGRPAPDVIKSQLLGIFVAQYGDPRLAGSRAYQWAGVSERALSVMNAWLVGDTLTGFMRILERTADEIWQYRQKFWMAYYNAGHIQEAWLALGKQASHLAGRVGTDHNELGHGLLEGGAMPNQSVLLLKIGDLLFTEWSHNGSLRAFREHDRSAPELYQQSYSGHDLRNAASLDFHDGVNDRPQLTHSHSDRGTWQRKARDFIRHHTGVFLKDREIL